MIPVVKEKIKVKLALTIPTDSPAVVLWDVQFILNMNNVIKTN